MVKFAGAALLIALGGGTMWGAGKAEAPPKELVQYVLNTRRLGLKDPTIRKNAVAVGWPAAMVDEAITFVKKTGQTSQITADSGEVGGTAGSGGNPTQPVSTTPPPPPSRQTPAALAPQTPASQGAAAPADSAETVKSRGVSDEYEIGAGDVLQISVWKEPDASVPSVVVRPDGKITVPLLKEITIAGMTPAQVEKLIGTSLAKFYNGAVDVTVVVSAINSKKIYVVGAARREGPLPYSYRMTIAQAISESGGLTEYAKRKKIYVLRTVNGKEFRLYFNYDEVLKGENMEQNIVLLPGDTLFVPH